MQKRGAEVEQHISASEQEYKKQYHRSRRILVVDDEPDITSSFKQPLRDNGFEVASCRFPGACLIQIKDAGHQLMSRYPYEINRVLQTFLSTTRNPG